MSQLDPTYQTMLDTLDALQRDEAEARAEVSRLANKDQYHDTRVADLQRDLAYATGERDRHLARRAEANAAVDAAVAARTEQEGKIASFAAGVRKIFAK